ncbi:hypothetical protein PGB90_007354 [Kerria lacca]
MSVKIQNIPQREDLLAKQIQLENENKELWNEIKEKKIQIVTLKDRLLLQENVLKNQTELKKLLNEYLETIRTLQSNINFLKNENKIVEQKFYKCQLMMKQQQHTAGDDPQHKKLCNENFALKMKLHAVEKELRHYMHLWNKNVHSSSSIITARETIMNLEQKLIECQPIVSECKLTKDRLIECEEKLKSTTFMNAVLKDELEKVKISYRELIDKNEELKKHTTKYMEMISKLKQENISMEHFIEKSFRLEGALAELDDLNVVLKKQETMLGVLFDENQSLKEGISHLFDDMNTLKDRNWKLEKYATDMEDSFYKAEKNVNSLEHKLDYYRELQIENEKLKLYNGDVKKDNKRLENTTDMLALKLDNTEKKLETTLHTLNILKDDKQKLSQEITALRNDFSINNMRLEQENEHLKREYEKQKLVVGNYSHLSTDLKALQKKYIESQEQLFKVSEEARKLKEENDYLKRDINNLDHRAAALRAGRERYQKELQNVESKFRQLERQLNIPRSNPNVYNY